MKKGCIAFFQFNVPLLACRFQIQNGRVTLNDKRSAERTESRNLRGMIFRGGLRHDATACDCLCGREEMKELESVSQDGCGWM